MLCGLTYGTPHTLPGSLRMLSIHLDVSLLFRISQKLTRLTGFYLSPLMIVHRGAKSPVVASRGAPGVPCAHMGACLGARPGALREEYAPQTPINTGVFVYNYWKSRCGVTVPHFSTPFLTIRTRRYHRKTCTRRSCRTRRAASVRTGSIRRCLVCCSDCTHYIFCFVELLPYRFFLVEFLQFTDDFGRVSIVTTHFELYRPLYRP